MTIKEKALDILISQTSNELIGELITRIDTKIDDLNSKMKHNAMIGDKVEVLQPLMEKYSDLLITKYILAHSSMPNDEIDYDKIQRKLIEY